MYSRSLFQLFSHFFLWWRTSWRFVRQHWIFSRSISRFFPDFTLLSENRIITNFSKTVLCTGSVKNRSKKSSEQDSARSCPPCFFGYLSPIVSRVLRWRLTKLKKLSYLGRSWTNAKWGGKCPCNIASIKRLKSSMTFSLKFSFLISLLGSLVLLNFLSNHFFDNSWARGIYLGGFATSSGRAGKFSWILDDALPSSSSPDANYRFESACESAFDPS